MPVELRRVVVTGVGLVTPCGVGTDATWEALLDGRGGIGPITRFDATDYPARIAGEVDGFEPTQWITRKEVKKMDRFIHFAVAASMMALEDAGVPVPVPNPDQVGTLIGVGLCGLETLEIAADIVERRGPKRVSPFMIPRLIANLAPGTVSIMTGARGPNLSSVSACATGAHSVGDAARLIRWGEADMMIAGGAEATITKLGIAGFAAMRALSTRNEDPQTASRPFDKGRDGFVAAEGAGVLILESLEHAQARGAHIYCELAGYGQSSDAYHMTKPAPDGRGAISAMRKALKDAGATLEQVDYINAHGTSTAVNDASETQAIKTLFGPLAYQVPISSTKSMTGHMLGAAGAVEAAICALVIDRGEIPPTINQIEPDDDCDLDYVPNQKRVHPVKLAISNSFGFGGTNVCLAFRKLEV